MTTGLLIIDLQCGMFGGTLRPAQGDDVLGRAAGLLHQARSRGVPVFHVQHDGGPSDPLGKPSAGWEIHPAVRPIATEPVVGKTVCSLSGYRPRRPAACPAVDRLVVAGMQTEYCVDTTCRAAFGLGYRVVLVGDAHTTFDTPVLTAAQVIAHHNRTLSGSFVELATAGDVVL